MRNRKFLIYGAIIWMITASVSAYAHTLFMAANVNENGTVTIECIFSTGGIAIGFEVRLEDDNGRVLWRGKTNAEGKATFERPEVPYSIIVDEGPNGHKVVEDGI
jgi:hypothetical protein